MPNPDSNIEVWKPVVGHEGIYSISSHGQLRRDKPENNTYVGRILRPDFPVGYAQYTLHHDGIRYRYKAHQLVAAAFIGPCPDGKQVNHIDGVKTNNFWKNLEYVTGLENHQHASRIGLKAHGEGSGVSTLTEEAVHFIRKNYKPYHKEFGLLPLSKRFNVWRTTISDALYGNTWSHIEGAHP